MKRGRAREIALYRKNESLRGDFFYYVGTIRTNLDPFNNYDDAALWSALRLSHLGIKI